MICPPLCNLEWREKLNVSLSKNWSNKEYLPYYSLNIPNLSIYSFKEDIYRNTINFKTNNKLKDFFKDFIDNFSLKNNIIDLLSTNIQNNYLFYYYFFKQGLFNNPNYELQQSILNKGYNYHLRRLSGIFLFYGHTEDLGLQNVNLRNSLAGYTMSISEGFCSIKKPDNTEHILWTLVYKKEYFEYIRLYQLIKTFGIMFTSLQIDYDVTGINDFLKEYAPTGDMYELWVNRDFDKNKGLFPRVRTVYRKNVVKQCIDNNIPIIHKTEEELNNCFFSIPIHREKTIKDQKNWTKKVGQYFLQNYNKDNRIIPIKTRSAVGVPSGFTEGGFTTQNHLSDMRGSSNIPLGEGLINQIVQSTGNDFHSGDRVTLDQANSMNNDEFFRTFVTVLGT